MMDHCEFKVSLAYELQDSQGYTAQRNPVLKKQKEKRNLIKHLPTCLSQDSKGGRKPHSSQQVTRCKIHPSGFTVLVKNDETPFFGAILLGISTTATVHFTHLHLFFPQTLSSSLVWQIASLLGNEMKDAEQYLFQNRSEKERAKVVPMWEQ